MGVDVGVHLCAQQGSDSHLRLGAELFRVQLLPCCDYRTFNSLVERIRQALPYQRKKQFQEKNLYEKLVIPAFTSQTGENQHLSPPYSNFWFLPRSHPRITPAPMRMTTTTVMALLLLYRLVSRCACVRIRYRHPSCRRSLSYSS